MQTSPVKPSLRDHDVVRVPEAGPRRPGARALAIAAAVLVALVLGAALGNVWGRRGVQDTRDQAAGAVIAARDAQAAAVRAAASAADTSEQLAVARNDLRQALAGAALVRGSREELRRMLADARGTIADMNARLGKARAQSRAATTPLPNGTHIGRIWAVGATPSPPRIVFDGGAWFRGGAAQAAAALDGVIGPNDPWPPGRYFRNRDVRWSTPRVAPGAQVTLWHLGGDPGKRVVGIEDLARVFGSDAAWAQGIRNDPFWVTVRAGSIIKVRQQRYR